MPVTTFVDGAIISAAEHNANWDLAVLSDTPRTISVTHEYTATQTFTGGLTAAAPITVTSTSTQFQLKYDGSNHVTVAVSSAGLVTLNATGASASFSFSDVIAVTGVSGGVSATLTGGLVCTTISATAGAFSGAVAINTAGGAASLTINATTRFYLDGVAGVGGNTFVEESSADLIGFIAGGALRASIGASGITSVAGITATTGAFADNLGTATAKKLGLNVGLTSYLSETSAGQISVFAGGVLAGLFTSSGISLNSRGSQLELTGNGTGSVMVGTTGDSVGFYSVTPVARQLMATGTGKTVDNVIAALQTLGVFRQS